jgi:AraC-like DNA-binding protein
VRDFATRLPTPQLRAFVDRYLGYRLLGFDAGLHRGVPSRHMTFIVSIGAPIDVVAQTDPSQRPDRYRCVLGGLQASAALISHDGTQEGVAIGLTPLGSRVLFGLPARELWDRSLECSDVAGRPGDVLWERLQDTSTWRQRFAVCDEVLSGLARDVEVSGELERSWRALVESGGRIPITTLASSAGYSRQHLARRLRDEFGLGPKLAARIIRFERAHRMLTGTPSYVSLSQVAAACGYYDQAHLHRDVVALAGCTPTKLLAEELPFFHDEDAAAG